MLLARAATATASATSSLSPLLLTLNPLRALLPSFSYRDGLYFAYVDTQRREERSYHKFTRPYNTSEAPRQEKEASSPASSPSTSSSTPTATTPSPKKKIIYRAQGMVPLRLAVRLKVFHLLAAASAAGPAATIAGGGSVPPLDAVFAVTLAASAGGAAAALAWLSRRYVGEISTDKSKQSVTISTLGFWGERIDSEFPAAAVIPAVPSRTNSVSSSENDGDDDDDAAKAAVAAAEASLDTLASARPLLAFDVEGDKQFLVSLRFSSFSDRRAMLRLLSGEGV
jgi:hypothetical protein